VGQRGTEGDGGWRGGQLRATVRGRRVRAGGRHGEQLAAVAKILNHEYCVTQWENERGK
jgi:hypothetical protein